MVAIKLLVVFKIEVLIFWFPLQIVQRIFCLNGDLILTYILKMTQV
jgi:hypothetical protein